jgi:hypothetical protein
VAIVYNPVYGKNLSSVDMKLNVKTPVSLKLANGTPVVSGGLRLTRNLYCKIFNGEIVNWNDPAFTPINSKTTLRDTLHDDLTRWNQEGAPVRLVGRLDKSGTTDVFTRHLAAICSGVSTNNWYTQNAETLPYNSSSGVDLHTIRSDTGYQPGGPTPAGTHNLVSGDYFDGTAIQHVNGPTSTPTQAGAGSPVNGVGLYLLGDGGGKVRDAILLPPDFTAASGYKLNGKVGYIGGDFVINSASVSHSPVEKGLFAAQLQVGVTPATGTVTKFAMPTAALATAAFGTGTTLLLPPQSTSTGAYNSTDARQVHLVPSGTGDADRANPVAWTDVLYVTINGNNLAAPLAGYPITGTTQYYGYTCYATPANRYAIEEFLGLNFGKVTKTSTNTAFAPNTFKGPGATSLGIVPQSNIGLVPPSWQTALTETFLKKSTQSSGGGTLGSRNLWIQSNFVLKNPLTGLLKNPGCAEDGTHGA